MTREEYITKVAANKQAALNKIIEQYVDVISECIENGEEYCEKAQYFGTQEGFIPIKKALETKYPFLNFYLHDPNGCSFYVITWELK